MLDRGKLPTVVVLADLPRVESAALALFAHDCRVRALTVLAQFWLRHLVFGGLGKGGFDVLVEG